MAESVPYVSFLAKRNLTMETNKKQLNEKIHSKWKHGNRYLNQSLWYIIIAIYI